MKLTAFLLLATLCRAATVTVCLSGCTTTSLQTALDTTAACGDTIAIKSTETQTGNYTITYRNCAANPITVTSDRASWLPPTGGRVTPSQLGNMAKITTPNSSAAIAAALDGSNRPPAGWKFIGIAFTSSSSGPTYSLVDMNPYLATSSSQTPDNINFDRCYLYRSSTYTGTWSGGGTDLQNVIRLDATNSSVTNSFFGDGFYNGVESHGVSVLTSPGPVTVTNNFITTSGIPVFVGGAVPSYKTYLPNGMIAGYNYFWRPWKWNSDPAQPYAADYVTAASGTVQGGPYTITNVGSTGIITIPSAPNIWAISSLTIASVGGCTVANASGWRITGLTSTTFQLLNFPGCNSAYTSGGTATAYAISVCMKNLGELKWGVGVDWEHNVGENSWAVVQCGQQYNGFTNTLRTETDWSLTNAAIGLFSMSDATHITWSGSYRIAGSGANSTNTQDLSICLDLSTGMECHVITSYSGASLISATSFSTVAGGTVNGAISYASSAQLSNLTLSHNVWKNSDQAFSIQALSFNNGVGNAGYGKTQTISQNLLVVNSAYTTNPRVIAMSSGEAAYIINPTGYTIDHNTLYNPNGMAGSFIYLNGDQCPSQCGSSVQPKFDSSAVTNNLFGVSAAGGNGAFAGDSTSNTSATANAYFTNSLVENNGFPGGTNGTGGTGGNTVSGNINTAWSNPFVSGTYTVAAASAYYHAGTDGASLGADFTALPMVNNVAVTGNVLGFDVTPGVNSDVKATQPCVLEVSSSRNLASDLGTYSVIASLDPFATMGADLSTRSDVTLVGSHVTWPLTGLVAGTYYGRLMCYGDTEQFIFVVTATQTGSLLSGKSLVSGQALIH